jgi:hypothetical protein
MSSEHGTQKVHSKLQMQASAPFGVGTLHFSQFSFISSMGGPSSSVLNWPHPAATLAPKSDPICDYIEGQSKWAEKAGLEERHNGAIHRAG